MRNLIYNIILILAILWLVQFAQATEIHVKYVISSKFIVQNPTSRPAPKHTPQKEIKMTKTPSGGIVEDKLAFATAKAFGEDQVEAMKFIVFHESGYRWNAVNTSSGACGLGQALPCEKMGCQTLEDIDCQLRWLMQYVKNRYGSPVQARIWWQNHNWY